MTNIKTFLVGIAVGALLALPVGAIADPIEGQDWGIPSPPHTLCVTCSPDHGGVVGVWQSFLWGDGFHNKCGTSGIDGVFGSVTKADTKDWQSYHGQTVDGVVGADSWDHAKVYHVIHETGNDYHYSGVSHNVKLLTQGSSPVQWYFDTPTDSLPNQFFLTGHPDISWDTC